MEVCEKVPKVKCKDVPRTVSSTMPRKVAKYVTEEVHDDKPEKICKDVTKEVCPTSRLANLQVIEKSDAGGIVCGVTRISCEVGLPKYFLVDQHDATICALDSAELD